MILHFQFETSYGEKKVGSQISKSPQGKGDQVALGSKGIWKFDP